MPRYYCDYCDTYLTHDSPSVRKQHNAGYKHKANVRNYYQQFEEQQTQSLIDQRIKEHLGNAAAFQVGAAYAAAWQQQRPRPPILPVPPTAPLIPGRPPVLPRPMPGAPGYGSVPMPAPMSGAPGAPMAPMPGGALPGPPTIGAPTSLPGPPPSLPGPPTSLPGPPPPTLPGNDGPPAPGAQQIYQAPPTSGSFGGPNVSAAPNYQNAGGNSAQPATSSADGYTYPPQAPNGL